MNWLLQRVALELGAPQWFVAPPSAKVGIFDGAEHLRSPSLSSVPNGGEGRGGELLRAHPLQMGSKPSLPDIIRMATLTPAERTGLSADRGSLTPGKRADILILSPTLRVKQVFSGGMRLPA